jgi:hypothetical protein
MLEDHYRNAIVRILRKKPKPSARPAPLKPQWMVIDTTVRRPSRYSMEFADNWRNPRQRE